MGSGSGSRSGSASVCASSVLGPGPASSPPKNDARPGKADDALEGVDTAAAGLGTELVWASK